MEEYYSELEGKAGMILAFMLKNAIPKSSSVIVISSDLYTSENPRPAGKINRMVVDENSCLLASEHLRSRVAGHAKWTRASYKKAAIFLRGAPRSRALAVERMVALLKNEREK